MDVAHQLEGSEHSTIVSQLTLKINTDHNCFDYKPTNELLRLNMSAV